MALSRCKVTGLRASARPVKLCPRLRCERDGQTHADTNRVEPVILLHFGPIGVVKLLRDAGRVDFLFPRCRVRESIKIGIELFLWEIVNDKLFLFVTPIRIAVQRQNGVRHIGALVTRGNRVERRGHGRALIANHDDALPLLGLKTADKKVDGPAADRSTRGITSEQYDFPAVHSQFATNKSAKYEP